MDSMKEPFEETIKVTIKRNGQEMVTDTGTFALVAMNKRINDSMTETKVNVYGPTCVLEVAGMIKNMVQLLVDAGAWMQIQELCSAEKSKENWMKCCRRCRNREKRKTPNAGTKETAEGSRTGSVAGGKRSA